MLKYPFRIELHSLKILLSLANSVDYDEMRLYAVFHRVLHCLPKYPFIGFPVYKRVYHYPYRSASGRVINLLMIKYWRINTCRLLYSFKSPHFSKYFVCIYKTLKLLEF